MSVLLHPDVHTRVGRWLYLYRGWGLLPLLAAGLFISYKPLSVRSGILMMIIGGIGIICGTLLRIICYRYIGPESKQSENPVTTYIVKDGPFAVSRNPVYLADAAIVLGVAMMSRMPWLVGVTALAGGIGTALVIEWEEHVLRRYYGQSYYEYCRSVPRWFTLGRLFERETYLRSRSRFKLIASIRSESTTLLFSLTAILAFIVKAYVEVFS